MNTTPTPPERRSEGQDLVYVGTVVCPHGLEGALKIRVESDNPDRFRTGAQLLVVLPGRTVPGTVQKFVPLNRYGILKLSGIDDRDRAEQLRNAELAVPSGEIMALGDGQYYTFQILGLTVVSRSGDVLGKVKVIENMPAGDIYLVSGPFGNFYVPAKGDIIDSIDLGTGQMVINDVEGLR